MTLWDLREWIERRTPLWAYGIFVGAMLFGLVLLRALRRRDEKRRGIR